jgi:hypothetical protein
LVFTKPQPLTFTTGFPGLPSAQRPKAGDYQRRAKEFRASLRRKAQLKKAAEVLPELPGPGESLHTLLTGYFDFALVLTCVLRVHPVPCDHARVAALSFYMNPLTVSHHLIGWNHFRLPRGHHHDPYSRASG